MGLVCYYLLDELFTYHHDRLESLFKRLLLPVYWPALNIRPLHQLTQFEKENRANRINDLLFKSNTNILNRFVIRIFLQFIFYPAVDKFLKKNPKMNPPLIGADLE